MTPDEFLKQAEAAAIAAGHVWPKFAACEAALESAWGESKLCRMANNLFGQKSGFTTKEAEIIEIPTREFLKGQWVVVPAKWPKFADWSSSFAARMELLRAKSVYAPALAAATGYDFVSEVSKIWATDPKRGDKVLSIYRKHYNGGEA
jgi:flagellum-specific peptidoglycan hydrolase FlgJ